MKKAWPFLVAAVVLLGCICSLPAGLVTDTPSAPTPSVTCRPPEPPGGETDGFTHVQLAPEDGELATQLQEHAPKAAALGQHMFVEFDAAW